MRSIFARFKRWPDLSQVTERSIPTTPDEVMKRLLTCEIAQGIGGMPAYLVDDGVWAAAEAEADRVYIPLTEEGLAGWHRRDTSIADSIRWLNRVSAVIHRSPEKEP